MSNTKEHLILPRPNIRFEDDCLYSQDFNDIYFQKHFAIDEAIHTFCMANDLRLRFSALKPNETFRIGEVGFGTGLNFLLTYKLWKECAPKGSKLQYCSSEQYPLTKADIQQIYQDILNFSDGVDILLSHYPPLVKGVHQIQLDDVELYLLFDDAYKSFSNIFSIKGVVQFDAWFLDGFAPKKNSKCWSDDLIGVIAQLSVANETTLSTFSVARMVVDVLVNNGFDCQKIKGSGNKRQILKATFTSYKKIVTSQLTSWDLPRSASPLTKRLPIAVIGGGLAGCISAYQLATKGFQVDLFERGSALALAGSGNDEAVLDFRPSIYASPYNNFMLISFLYAIDFYEKLDAMNGNGLFRLAEGDQYLSELSTFFNNLPEIGEILNSKGLCQYLGVDLNKVGGYIKKAGYIKPKQLCQRLTEHSKINLNLCCEVRSLKEMNDHWLINEKDTYQAAIWATANNPTVLDSVTSYITSYPGYLYRIETSNKSKRLQATISGRGHLTPSVANSHGIALDDDLLDMLDLSKEKIISSRFAIRAKTYDYLPLIGPLAIRDEFVNCYHQLRLDKKAYIALKAPTYNHFYLCAGFGSHGVTTIPFAVNVLTSMLEGNILPIPRSLYRHLSPARVLVKALSSQGLNGLSGNL